MLNHHQLRRGLWLTLIYLSLQACQPTPAAIKTETVKVNVPVYIALPPELLCAKTANGIDPCAMPAFPATLTNGSMASYVLALQNTLKIDINRIQAISKIQP